MIVAERATGARCGRSKKRKGVSTPCQARAQHRVGVALAPGSRTPNKETVIFWLMETCCSGCRSALTFHEAMPTKRWMAMRDYVKRRHGFSLRRKRAALAFEPL